MKIGSYGKLKENWNNYLLAADDETKKRIKDNRANGGTLAIFDEESNCIFIQEPNEEGTLAFRIIDGAHLVRKVV